MRFLPGQAGQRHDQRRLRRNTEALRATVEFADGHFKSLKFNIDTLNIQLGSFLTLTAQNFNLDTGAGRRRAAVSFTSIGAP